MPGIPRDDSYNFIAYGTKEWEGLRDGYQHQQHAHHGRRDP
jgi:hypothetical protein